MNVTRSGSAVTAVLYKLYVQIKVYKTLGDSQKGFLPAAKKNKTYPNSPCILRVIDELLIISDVVPRFLWENVLQRY